MQWIADNFLQILFIWIFKSDYLGGKPVFEYNATTFISAKNIHMTNVSQSWSSLNLHACSHLVTVEYLKLIPDFITILCSTIFFGSLIDKTITQSKVVSYGFALVLFWSNFAWSILVLSDCRKSIEAKWKLELEPTKAFYSIAVYEPIMVSLLPLIMFGVYSAAISYCKRMERDAQLELQNIG